MSNIKNLDVLVMNAKQLNGDALVAIYDSYLPHVFRYIHYQVNDRAVAEALTSETFLRMLADIPDFREDGKKFYPWLLKIAKNTVLEHSSSRSSSRVLLDEEIGELLFEKGRDRENDFKKSLSEALDSEEIKKAVNSLEFDQRQVLLLKFPMGLSNEEVAEVLDTTENHVKSLQLKALGELEALFKGRRRLDGRIEPASRFERKKRDSRA